MLFQMVADHQISINFIETNQIPFWLEARLWEEFVVQSHLQSYKNTYLESIMNKKNTMKLKP